MYRIRNGHPEVFLAHPGGPFFARKDDGVWTIPKGEPTPDEPLIEAARREFEEETGIRPTAPLLPLGSVLQRGGKTVHAWAFQGEWKEEQELKSNTFRLEWPPHSGQFKEFPEIDRVCFFPLAAARIKINPAQVEFLDTLESHLNSNG